MNGDTVVYSGSIFIYAIKDGVGFFFRCLYNFYEYPLE